MRQRGRKSSASLAIVSAVETPRPAPPRSLPPAVKRLWRDVVGRFQPDHFIGAEPVLECYVEAVEMTRFLHQQIKATDPADHRRLAVLVRLQKAEALLVGNLAGKLRISPRSRFDRYSVRP